MAITITADMRETRSTIVQALRALPDVEVTVQELSCGDYLLREDFPVERKAAGDIYGTRSAMAPDAIRAPCPTWWPSKAPAFCPQRGRPIL